MIRYRNLHYAHFSDGNSPPNWRIKSSSKEFVNDAANQRSSRLQKHRYGREGCMGLVESTPVDARRRKLRMIGREFNTGSRLTGICIGLKLLEIRNTVVLEQTLVVW